jgi:hypothetical protein
MRADDPNLPDLRVVAQSLGDLCEQVVFLGGAVAGLLVTDPLADPVRATRDVDAVVNADRVHFYAIEEQLATRGFARDVRSDVICRWVHKSSGVVFDLMPVAPEVLGFSNFWYPYAEQSALPVYLGEGITIRLVSAVAFVATKLEAFASRGGGDLLGSHDLEDVLNIVDGRAELLAEFAVAPAALQQAVGAVFGGLLANPDFINVLPGMLADPERAEWVLGQLRALIR